MQTLRIMPSHTYFYKKLSQFGKDHDKDILDKIENEGKRRTSVLNLKKTASEHSATSDVPLEVSFITFQHNISSVTKTITFAIQILHWNYRSEDFSNL